MRFPSRVVVPVLPCTNIGIQKYNHICTCAKYFQWPYIAWILSILNDGGNLYFGKRERKKPWLNFVNKLLTLLWGRKQADPEWLSIEWPESENGNVNKTLIMKRREWWDVRVANNTMKCGGGKRNAPTTEGLPQ